MKNPNFRIHLIDGTYELFRAYFAMPPLRAPDGKPIGAVRGLLRTLLSLLRQDDVSHVACAFDHVVQSFRNQLFDGYKTGEGTPADRSAQFELAEQAAAALGIVVWPMVEFEADDALATAAHRWQDDPSVEQVVICSPDKDLAQMVRGQRVVCLDRRRGIVYEQEGVIEKFGVPPESIPDYLGLVGDAADGIPGIPKWGAKTAGLVLGHYGHIELIPSDAKDWEVQVRGAAGIAASLAGRLDDALFYRRLATLRVDVGLEETLDDLRWRGINRNEFEEFCAGLGISEYIQPNEWRVD